MFGNRKLPAGGPLANPTLPKPPLALTDLQRFKPDENGYMILDVFARKLPDYLVYRSTQRVAIQFADKAEEAAAQRKMMAALNPLRGEINGLIDGWRVKPTTSKAQRRAERFDRRVADALIAALEGDVASATLLLKQIKQDILDQRTAWGRFEYCIAAFLAGLVWFAFACAILLLGGRVASFPDVAYDLCRAAGAGLIGAFFSIALAIRGRTVLPDLQRLANSMDAVLRMLVGLIGAGVLVAMVDAHMVNISFGNLPSAPVTLEQPSSQTHGISQPISAQQGVTNGTSDEGTVCVRALVRISHG